LEGPQNLFAGVVHLVGGYVGCRRLSAGKGLSVFVVSRSQTDTPAKSGQASDDATAASHHLEDQIAIQIQKQYPCANVTEDRDIAAILKWEHDHALLGGNDESDLSAVAGSLGAKYLIAATVTQTGGQLYLQASCMDTAKAENTAKADTQTTVNDAADNAESLAKDFVAQLGSVFAVNPEDGKTYRGGTVVTAPCSCEGLCLQNQLRQWYHQGDRSSTKTVRLSITRDQAVIHELTIRTRKAFVDAARRRHYNPRASRSIICCPGKEKI
jgi:hypothetical protein